MATSPFDARSWTHINDLQSDQLKIAAIIFYLVARDLGLPVIIIESRRSVERQAKLVEAGRSLTLHSAHLEGRAFDCSFDKYGYDVPPYWWDVLGAIGEFLKLTWGGRWERLRDFGHFEAPADYTLPNHLFGGK